MIDSSRTARANDRIEDSFLVQNIKGRTGSHQPLVIECIEKDDAYHSLLIMVLRIIVIPTILSTFRQLRHAPNVRLRLQSSD